MDWLKRNWLSTLLGIVAAGAGVDVAAGLAGGKSLVNVAMLPSYVLGGGSAVTLFLRWLNGRTVTTRSMPSGLDPATQTLLEAIFTVAASPDITDEAVEHLREMAGSAVVGHAKRAKTTGVQGRVTVVEPMEQLATLLSEVKAKVQQ